jgi:hypothetical protein
MLASNDYPALMYVWLILEAGMKLVRLDECIEIVGIEHGSASYLNEGDTPLANPTVNGVGANAQAVSCFRNGEKSFSFRQSRYLLGLKGYRLNFCR